MREVLAKEYYFENDIEEVEFVGFDKSTDSRKKKKAKKTRRQFKNSSGRPYPPQDISLDPDAPKKRHPFRTWILAIFFGTAVAGAGKIR